MQIWELTPFARYKNGTSSQATSTFRSLPYRALRCDRCLVITTFCNLFAPFHGADAGSNPAGDAKSITHRGNIYSLFNTGSETVSSVGLDELATTTSTAAVLLGFGQFAVPH